MFCAMLGSLFTVLTILLFVQSSRAVQCSDNPGKGRLRRASFDNCYSKAVRELILDNVLISKTVRQQNKYHGVNVSKREGYNPAYGVGNLPACKNAADGMVRPALTGNSHVLHDSVRISNNKYKPYFS